MEGQHFQASYDPVLARLVVTGAIDEVAVDDFRRALREASAGYTRPVVIDLDGVTFLPCMAVGVLLGALADASGARVVAADGTPAHMVLEVLGLHEYATTGRLASGCAPTQHGPASA